MASKEVRQWSDEYMFEAEEIDANAVPQVSLISCNNDPLGSIAAAAKAYKGEFVDSLSEITDEERRYYLAEVQKTALAMPLEAVNFHFHVSGVTRGFTHQMVRQRTAAYSQESTRFAVKSTVPVGRPPSLEGTTGEMERIKGQVGLRFPFWRDFRPSLEDFALMSPENQEEVLRQVVEGQREWQFQTDRLPKAEQWRGAWDKTVEHIERAYNQMVNSGMPAEDARGLLPTNLLTQLNYFTNLRSLHVEAGKRLCTQAQFEWRIFWAQAVSAIREYGKGQTYSVDVHDGHSVGATGLSSAWQFEALAGIFKPVCYLTGSCQFNADFDRKCSIRDRVDQNAEVNRLSEDWGKAETYLGIPAIRPEEWLMDPGAAR